MAHSRQGDRTAWDEWAHRPKDLAATAAAIRAKVVANAPEPETREPEEYEAEDGRILYRLTDRRECDRK
jgi:hypothetical protein